MVRRVVALLTGPAKIDDCCCEMETVDLANQDQLHATLQRLRETRFFRIFQVNLDNECQFWQGYSMCHSPGCSVCECEDDDVGIPSPLLAGPLVYGLPTTDTTSVEGRDGTGHRSTVLQALDRER